MTVLTYHVLGGCAAGDLAEAQVETTLAGLSAVVTKMAGEEDGDAEVVKVNGTAMVTVANIKGTNGYIHVVDSVIKPATVLELASAHPSFSTLATAVGTLTASPMH